MDNIITGIVGLILAFLAGLFLTRRAQQKDAQILDLTSKIKDKQEEANKQKAEADKKVKEYLDALKEYDPEFDSDDDGAPSA